MERQKFSIDLREDIDSGKLKVVTSSGNAVKIYSWDCGNEEYPIIASVNGFAFNYSKSGEVLSDLDIKNKSHLDLYVIPFPVITDFEEAVMEVIGHAMGKDYPRGDEIFEDSKYYDNIKEVAARLQERAIKDFIKITTAYSINPVVKHDTQGGKEYVHYMNFCFYPTVFQKLLWVKKKYFPGLLEEDNKNG